MKWHKKLTILLVLFTSFSMFSHAFVVEASGKVTDGSSIAGVALEGLTYEEAKIRIQEHVANWLSEGMLVADSDFESLEIPRSIFEFDIDASLEELEQKTKRKWSTFFLKEKNVHLPLMVDVKEENIEEWPDNVDVNKTLSKASTIASNLGEENVSLVYLQDPTAEHEELASVRYTIPMISDAVTGHLADELDGYTISPNSAFSFLDSIKLLEGMANSEEEMSFVATALYDLVLQTNLEIVARTSQGGIPSYAEAGIEVSVNKQEEVDFLLFNPAEQPYTIRAEVSENELLMAIESVPSERTYGYLIENEVEIEPRTIYRYSPNLAYGAEEVIQNGKEGLQVEVYRTTEHLDGSMDQERISRDYYPPTPEIVLVSTTQGTESITGDMLDSQIEGIGLPENTDLNDLLNGEDTEDTDDNQSTDNRFNIETLLFSCLLKNNSDSSNQNTESEESEGNEESFEICDLLILYLLSSMGEKGNMNESDEDGEESGLSLDELLKNNNLPTLPEEENSETEEEVIRK